MTPTLTQTERRQDADEIAVPTQTARRQDADEIALPTQTQRRPDADEIALPTQAARRQDADGIPLPTQTERRQDADEIALPTQTERRQDADETALPTQTARRQDADEIALLTQTERRQDADEIALPTQTEHRPDQESVQFPADEAQEPLFTRMADMEVSAQTPFSITPHPSQVYGGWDADDAAATQTGPGQDPDRMQISPAWQIPADPVDAPSVTRTAPEAAIQALAAPAKARLGMAPDPAEKADGARGEAAATQTGRRPDQRTRSVLTDAVKAFIVCGLAHDETPSRVAASVQARFGIAIDRRQVYAYDPAGSRPPAQRWIKLHAATRAKFLAQARRSAPGDGSLVRTG
jgi:hypothetical protein